MARKSLEKWIDEALKDANKGNVVAIQVAHMIGTSPKEVYTWRLLKGNQVGTAKSYADACREKAEVCCQDFRGVHTFNVIVFYDSAETDKVAYPFAINSPGVEGEGLMTEMPNGEGRLAQDMRHKEMWMQQVFRQSEILANHYQRVVEFQSRENQTLREENADAFNIVKEMLMQKVQEDRNFALALEDKRKARELQNGLVRMVPPLLNTLTGTEVVPQSFADTSLIDTLCDKVKPEQIAMLGPILGLSQEEQALFVQRIAQREKQKEDEENKARAMVVQGSDPIAKRLAQAQANDASETKEGAAE